MIGSERKDMRDPRREIFFKILSKISGNVLNGYEGRMIMSMKLC